MAIKSFKETIEEGDPFGFVDIYQRVKREQEMASALQDFGSNIGTSLGFGGLALLASFGGLLLFKGLAWTAKGFKDTFRKIFPKKDELERMSKGVPSLSKESSFQTIKAKVNSSLTKFEEFYPSLFKAIESKDPDKVKEEFKDVELKTRKNPEFKKALITKITSVLETPPLYYGNTGNETYKFIKVVLGISEARAAAEAVVAALKKISTGVEKNNATSEAMD